MNVLIAGDFSPMNRVDELIESEEYSTDIVKDIKCQDEIFIINFESVIAEGDFQKIKKIGPHLRCSKKSASYLKEIGVSVATLANNHTLDYGEKGLLNTIDFLKEQNIKIVGAGKNITEARKPQIISKNGETLAIVNCCEHEFSYAEANKAGTNPLDPIQQFYSIKEASQKADYVLVIVHGGHEYFNLPSSRMVQTYHFFIDAGADVVINHHQHCYSGYEYYKGKPIFYGLGNFCFDWPGKNPSFYTGYCVRLYLDDKISSTIVPYTQCLDDPYIKFGEMSGFRDDIQRINDIIKDDHLLEQEVNSYYRSRINSCKCAITPYGNKYLDELATRGYIPRFISEEKKLLLKAYIDCESHREVILDYLKKKN